MKRSCIAIAILVASLLAVPMTLAGDDAKKSSPFDAVKALEGDWTGHKNMNVSFHVVAGGSVVIETMFPGTPEEMVNAYHMDGDKFLMTHYCASGNQPRLKMSSNDKGEIAFDLQDVTNAKPGKPVMGRLVIKIDGDKLTESWSDKKPDGTLGEAYSFEFTRKK